MRSCARLRPGCWCGGSIGWENHMTAEATRYHPRHAPLVWGVCALQVVLIAAPFFISAILPVVCVLTLVSAVALFGSITLSVLYLCFVAAVVPSWFYEDYLLLPLDFKFYEGLFALVMGMACLTHLSEGRWELAAAHRVGSTDMRVARAGGFVVRARPDIRAIGFSNAARCALSPVLRAIFRGDVVFRCAPLRHLFVPVCGHRRHSRH